MELYWLTELQESMWQGKKEEGDKEIDHLSPATSFPQDLPQLPSDIIYHLMRWDSSTENDVIDRFSQIDGTNEFLSSQLSACS
jgi:hypothetical protein